MTRARPLLAVLLLAACAKSRFSGGEEAEAESEAEGERADAGAPCRSDEDRCADGGYYTCRDGRLTLAAHCGGLPCQAGRGCFECAPGTPVCQGQDVRACAADGRLGETTRTCDVAAGEDCQGGACLSACEAAAASDSYLGCVYFPTVTLNSQLGVVAGGTFDFAVAVANPAAAPGAAQVRITRGAEEVATRTVAPGEVATIVLPWVAALRQQIGVYDWEESSVLVADGAYRLESTLPVAAYQFNPLQFSVTQGCARPLRECNSYTNDASLLLPEGALGTEYLAVARPTFGEAGGFVAIVATVDDTEVTVELSAAIRGGDGVSAREAGDSFSTTLDAGDVLQLVSDGGDYLCDEDAACRPDGSDVPCVAGRRYDLTGTRVRAPEGKPLAVFSGHSCTFVPFNRYACDHLEEQIFPLDTWGTRLMATSTQPQVAGEPNVFRVVSGSAANAIEFDPPVHAPTTLDEPGDFVEFEHAGAFRVRGTGRLAIAQFMVGEDRDGCFEPPAIGDPAMGLAIPYDQFRTSYDFLAPDTYTSSFVNVIAPLGATITLDGGVLPAEDFEPIGDTGFVFSRWSLAPGAHHMEGDLTFGITVSGIASYTSYLYPGGLDLRPIPLE